MQLQLSEQYKSLSPFSVSLPDFTILTGINGSGKTQILKAINERKIKAFEEGNEIIKIYYSPYPTLLLENNYHHSNGSLEGRIGSITTLYKEYVSTSIGNSISLEAYYKSKNLSGSHKLIEKISNTLNKDIRSLTDFEIKNYYPTDHIPEAGIFQQNITVLFENYRSRLHRNSYNRIINEHDSTIHYFNKAEFDKLYGDAPWDTINRILTEAHLTYRIKPISLNTEINIELTFESTIDGSVINLDELSSGEKVLMSLAMALYNLQFDISIPELMLLDEPDASLHPSMAKQFLDVVQNVFVKERGIKVVITTHSPSTVALAPEESLFVVDRTGRYRVQKVSKDKALQTLTAGLPSFSINYENRRQVFVESLYDVKIYEKVYSKLKERLSSEVSLHFISSAFDSHGDCEKVKTVVKALTDFGSKSAFGIIDWDTKNHGNKYVKVIGPDTRYNIESYIFDPIILAAFLLSLKNQLTAADFDLTNDEKYYDFKSLTTGQLQTVADHMTSKIAHAINPTDTATTQVQYVNGTEINLPNWYLTYPGHELEKLIKQVFPWLNKINKDTFELKRQILDTVIDDVPELIPTDFLTLFKSIQDQ